MRKRRFQPLGFLAAAFLVAANAPSSNVLAKPAKHHQMTVDHQVRLAALRDVELRRRLGLPPNSPAGFSAAEVNDVVHVLVVRQGGTVPQTVIDTFRIGPRTWRQEIVDLFARRHRRGDVAGVSNGLSEEAAEHLQHLLEDPRLYQESEWLPGTCGLRLELIVSIHFQGKVHNAVLGECRTGLTGKVLDTLEGG
jgi:hypothetical protein